MEEIHICSICLEDDTQSSYVTSCNHRFHFDCIHQWVTAGHTCPLCRAAVVFERALVPALQPYRALQPMVPIDIPAPVPLHDPAPGLHIPLPFWFSRDASLAIPSVALPYANRHISFALYPDSYQPSGHINVSRARDVHIQYNDVHDIPRIEPPSLQADWISTPSPNNQVALPEGRYINQDNQLVALASALNFLMVSDGVNSLRYST